MRGLRLGTVALGVLTAAAIAPGVARANDPADSITLAGPSGPNYASYPIAFTGGGTTDGQTDDGGYSTVLVWVPAGSGIFTAGCPQSLGAAAQAIDYAGGGPNAIYDYSTVGVGTNLIGQPGPYTYDATINGDSIAPPLTEPGDYTACAYLTDSFMNTTYAVSAAVPFTVGEPPGTSNAPGGFGGPPGKTGHPSDLTLNVALSRKLRDPGRNLLEVSGLEPDPGAGSDFLVVDVNLASHSNGCASNEQQNDQITQADGGAVLAREQVSPSASGEFRSPVALALRHRVAGTYVVCAYLTTGLDTVAVGFDRITVSRQPSDKRHRHRKHAR